MARFDDLLAAGYTAFAIHHGSAPRFKVPDAVSDVRAAIRHIKINTERYGVAADRLGVYGGSAGGHFDTGGYVRLVVKTAFIFPILLMSFIDAMMSSTVASFGSP